MVEYSKYVCIFMKSKQLYKNIIQHYFSNKITDPFWKDSVLSLVHFQEQLPFHAKYILHQPMLYDESIFMGNTSIFFNSWYNACLRYVCDIFDRNDLN